MYNFVNGKEGRHSNSLEKIIELEAKYSFIFSKSLKEYYYRYDGEKINLVTITIDGYECEVAKIVPIISEKMNFEKIADDDRADGFISNDFYPMARDRGGNYYYWNANTDQVYLVLVDDYENPFLVANSTKEFFELLNK